MMPGIIGRVFVGVDGSPGSLHALRRAVAFARAFETPLQPVLAWQPPGGEAQARVRPVPELERLWSRNAEDRLNAAFEQGLGALPLDLDCEPHIVRGPTGRVLVALADRPDDLLVVGAGRHGTLPRRPHPHRLVLHRPRDLLRGGRAAAAARGRLAPPEAADRLSEIRRARQADPGTGQARRPTAASRL